MCRSRQRGGSRGSSPGGRVRPQEDVRKRPAAPATPGAPGNGITPAPDGGRPVGRAAAGGGWGSPRRPWWPGSRWRRCWPPGPGPPVSAGGSGRSWGSDRRRRPTWSMPWSGPSRSSKATTGSWRSARPTPTGRRGWCGGSRCGSTATATRPATTPAWSRSTTAAASGRCVPPIGWWRCCPRCPTCAPSTWRTRPAPPCATPTGW